MYQRLTSICRKWSRGGWHKRRISWGSPKVSLHLQGKLENRNKQLRRRWCSVDSVGWLLAKTPRTGVYGGREEYLVAEKVAYEAADVDDVLYSAVTGARSLTTQSSTAATSTSTAHVTASSLSTDAVLAGCLPQRLYQPFFAFIKSYCGDCSRRGNPWDSAGCVKSDIVWMWEVDKFPSAI